MPAMSTTAPALCCNPSKLTGRPVLHGFRERPKASGSGKVIRGTFDDECAMPEQSNFSLPANLPRPVDDGKADHLWNMAVPRISLPSTAGRIVDLSDFDAPRTLIYCYPMTEVPEKPLPPG